MKSRFVWLFLGLFSLSFIGATTPPTIALQPQNFTRLEGNPVTFLVGAQGDELTFQWMRNGVDIPGATQAIFGIEATTLADNGATFDARVTNDKGTVVSCKATLTILPKDSGGTETSSPACPDTPPPNNNSGGGGSGGCGGGGGGGGGNLTPIPTATNNPDPGNPDPGTPDPNNPLPHTRWKGSVKNVHHYKTPAQDLTETIEGADVVFESVETGAGLTLYTVEGSLTMTRQVSYGSQCSESGTANGKIKPRDGNLVFIPDPPPPQHALERKYEGGGTASELEGTLIQSCPNPISNTWSSGGVYLKLKDQKVSADMRVISGTYTTPDTGLGTDVSDWNLVKQP